MEHMTQPPIVVGVDGSLSALRAVRWAAGEAARRRVPIRLVSVYTVPVETHGGGDRRWHVTVHDGMVEIGDEFDDATDRPASSPGAGTAVRRKW